MTAGRSAPATAPTPPRTWRHEAPTRARFAQRLASFDRQAVDHAFAALRPAAVAVVLTDAGHGADLPGMPRHTQWSQDLAVLLTRRSGRLRQHAGQWALPGGRIDDGETPEATALRELSEEVGLRLGPDAVLGRLDDYPTRSGYLISPVVVWAHATDTLQANPDEVASIHRLPAAELLRDDAPMLELTPQGPHPVLRMPVGSEWIAAPTAAVLFQFRELLLCGRATRVAQFDQPRFAWA